MDNFFFVSVVKRQNELSISLHKFCIILHKLILFLFWKLMQTYANLCKLMHTYANYAHLCKSYANLFQFILFEYFWSLQPHSRKSRRRRTNISGDLREYPPPRVSAPPLSDGVRHEEPMPIFAEVPSERLLGESRREELKRKAEHLSRSLCESFSFVTSKTMSIKDTSSLSGRIPKKWSIFDFLRGFFFGGRNTSVWEVPV